MSNNTKEKTNRGPSQALATFDDHTIPLPARLAIGSLGVVRDRLSGRITHKAALDANAGVRGVVNVARSTDALITLGEQIKPYESISVANKEATSEFHDGSDRVTLTEKRLALARAREERLEAEVALLEKMNAPVPAKG